jgi:hypothetical protein
MAFILPVIKSIDNGALALDSIGFFLRNGYDFFSCFHCCAIPFTGLEFLAFAISTARSW